MVLNDLLVPFIPREVLTHSRKGKPLDKFEYRTNKDKKLCVICCLSEDLTGRDEDVGLNTISL